MFIFYGVLAVVCYLYAKRHKTDRALYVLVVITAILFGAAAIMALVRTLFTVIVLAIALALIWHFFLRPALFGSRR